MPRDDDEDPRPKRRPRDDDDDEPRPKKRRDDEAPRTMKRPRDEDEAPRTMKRPRDEQEDDYDDAPSRRKKSGKKGEGLAKVIPYKNKLALMAYYIGVFSFIPVACFILGPIAFILGIFGLIKALKNPKARGLGHAWAGIILGLASPPLWVILWYTVFESVTNPVK
jgi:hypothetical protein